MVSTKPSLLHTFTALCTFTNQSCFLPLRVTNKQCSTKQHPKTNTHIDHITFCNLNVIWWLRKNYIAFNCFINGIYTMITFIVMRRRVFYKGDIVNNEGRTLLLCCEMYPETTTMYVLLQSYLCLLLHHSVPQKKLDRKFLDGNIVLEYKIVKT